MTKKTIFICLILLSFVQFSFAQQKSKQVLVNELVSETSEIFPATIFTELLQKVTDQKFAEMEKELTQNLTTKIDSNDKIPMSRKAEVKEKISKLTQGVSQIVKDITTKNFTVEVWANESFQTFYSEKFTTTELKNLNAYFKTVKGKRLVQTMKKFVVAGMKNQDVKSNDAENLLMGKFLMTSYGKKFFDVLMDGVFKNITGKIEDWSVQIKTELDKSMTTGELKQLMEEFPRKKHNHLKNAGNSANSDS